MAGDSNNISPGNGCVLTEMVDGKQLGLPKSGNAQSDPTVLKSLRAFRPNAHKSKNDFFQSVTENCYNSKTVSARNMSNKKSSIFDCNDNKFIGKAERFSFDNKDMELHFRTGGVRTKQYNDVRTFKEDLMSVSNIPNVTNNATVNVVHVHESAKLEESSQNVQSGTVNQQVTTVASTLPSSSSTVQKPKSENESQGSQGKKSTSSQPLSQNAVVGYTSWPITTASTIVTSSVPRVSPAPRPGGTYVTSNQLLTSAAIRPGSTKGIGQPQYMAIVHRNSFNQSNNPTSQVQTIDCQNVSNSVVGFVANSNIKSTGQNFITQATRAPVQTARVVAVPTGSTSRFILESDRPNVVLSKNIGVHNVRAATPTLYNHVTAGLNNGGNQVKLEESSSAVASTTSVPVEGSEHSTLALENTVEANLTPKVTAAPKTSDLQKPRAEGTIVPGPATGFLNSSNPISTLRLPVESDVSFFKRNTTYSKNPAVTNVSTNQTLRGTSSKAPHTVILQCPVPVVSRNSSLNESTKRSFSLVKAQASSEQADVASGSMTNVTNVTPLTLDLRNVSTASATTVATVSATMTTTTTIGNRSYGTSNLIAHKTPYNEVVRIVQGMTNRGQTTAASTLGVTDLNASSTSNQTPAGESSGDVIAIIEPSAAVKLDATSVPSRNILAAVLKRNSVANLLTPISTSAVPQYSVQTSRNPIEVGNQGEGVQNVMITQSSNSSTIHYTVVNPMQQDAQQQNTNTIPGDLKQNSFENTPQSIISPLIGQIESSEFVGEAGAGNRQQVVPEVKKVNRSDACNSTVQTEGGFIRKQVLNNQKITILVQNNDGDREKSENLQKNKLNELLYRDDQKTCITFRAIKRNQTDGNAGDSPAKKKNATENSNGESQKQLSSEAGSETEVQGNASESMCQYLVLEAINDPAGALPKFNQAFGKSYQVWVRVIQVSFQHSLDTLTEENVFLLTGKNSSGRQDGRAE